MEQYIQYGNLQELKKARYENRLDIYANNHYVFRMAYLHGYVDVLEWLHSINPRLYEHMDMEVFDAEDSDIDSDSEVSCIAREEFIIGKTIVREHDDFRNPLGKCSICLYRNSNILTKCKHQFCESCIFECFQRGKNHCPLCRRVILVSDLARIIDSFNSIK